MEIIEYLSTCFHASTNDQTIERRQLRDFAIKCDQHRRAATSIPNPTSEASTKEVSFYKSHANHEEATAEDPERFALAGPQQLVIDDIRTLIHDYTLMDECLEGLEDETEWIEFAQRVGKLSNELKKTVAPAGRDGDTTHD